MKDALAIMTTAALAVVFLVLVWFAYHCLHSFPLVGNSSNTAAGTIAIGTALVVGFAVVFGPRSNRP